MHLGDVIGPFGAFGYNVLMEDMIAEHFAHPGPDTQRLMELLGHTPFEVAIGALIGVASAFAWIWFFS